MGLRELATQRDIYKERGEEMKVNVLGAFFIETIKIGDMEVPVEGLNSRNKVHVLTYLKAVRAKVDAIMKGKGQIEQEKIERIYCEGMTLLYHKS